VFSVGVALILYKEDLRQRGGKLRESSEMAVDDEGEDMASSQLSAETPAACLPVSLRAEKMN
jgi:hypothetical protein